jgi:hypothetical protein
MKVVALKDITRKDLTIHYRREFTGSAVFECLDKKMREKRLEFVLEHSPTGSVEVRVNFIDEIEYPLLPIIKSLKLYISDLDRKGQLP